MFDVSRLHKWQALSRREQKWLGEAALLLTSVRLLQRTLPFRRWRRLLTRSAPARPPRSGEPSPAELARAIERARRLPGEYTCLPAAYALHLLLHRHGYRSSIQVGVARDAHGKVEAHAWLEYDGQILIGGLPDLGRFVPLPALEV